MKHAQRIFVICLAVMMMCTSHVWAAHPFPSEVYPDKYVYYTRYDPGQTSNKAEVYGTVETGIYGMSSKRLAYPITVRLFDQFPKGVRSYRCGDYGKYYFIPDGYEEWYDYIYKSYPESKLVQYMSYLWLTNYRTSDPEVWPAEYLDKFEELFDGHRTELTPSGNLKYRVDSYEWAGRTLSVTCSADYDIKKYDVRSEYDLWYDTYRYYLTADGDNFALNACIAVTDKSDGELIYLVKHISFTLEPDYVCEPGTYTDVLPYTSKERNTPHSGTSTKTLRLVIPKLFDPEKHDVTLYFYDTEYEGNALSLRFFNPQNISPIVTEPPANPDIPAEPICVPGDANGDGSVNAADAATISRYLSGAETEISAGADYNGDGLISASDLLLLRRKIAGADV